jgi:uncharacterized OB-fold protein
VYTETVVWAPPQAYAADAPYQLAIVDLDAGGRITGRILNSKVQIGDRVRFSEYRNGVAYFRKS